MSNVDRKMYIEWISLIEDYSIGEKARLDVLSDESLERRYRLALIKSTDEISN